MRFEIFFPTILMIIDVLAALVWFSQGDIRKCIYWMAAATLTAVVTF